MIEQTRRIVIWVAALIVLTAVAGATEAGRAHAAGTTYFDAECSFSPKYKPAQIIIACADGGDYVGAIQWHTWGGATATGSGVEHIKTCVPSCSESRFARYPVRLVLSKRRYCSKHTETEYRRLTVTFTDRRPNGVPRTQTSGFPC